MNDHLKKLLINCDMGEWDAPHLEKMDHKIMPLIDLSNVACGGHAGSKNIIEETLRCAKDHGIKVGAHPGYPDRINFGRSYISFDQYLLSDTLKNQLDLFFSSCVKIGIDPFHIKAHGALYHACNHRKPEAELMIQLIADLYPDIMLLVTPGSLLASLAKNHHIKTMSESFIDRQYTEELSLVPRNEQNAVITDVKQAQKQFNLLSIGKITTRKGTVKNLISKTACIHGDNPNCLSILNAIHRHG